MEFIGIGPNCISVDLLLRLGLRKKSYPFDYIISSLEMVEHCIHNRFEIFLDKQYYKAGSAEDVNEPNTHHLFYSKMIDTEILRRHHNTNNLPDIANNLKNREIFLHHNLLDNDTYLAFTRRCKRLLDLIDENKKITFLYCNAYTEDFDDIVKFHNSFLDKENIYTVGIFQNNGEKKILYENGRCKIYQNYEPSTVLCK
jgi:hypothetical protein